MPTLDACPRPVFEPLDGQEALLEPVEAVLDLDKPLVRLADFRKGVEQRVGRHLQDGRRLLRDGGVGEVGVHVDVPFGRLDEVAQQLGPAEDRVSGQALEEALQSVSAFLSSDRQKTEDRQYPILRRSMNSGLKRSPVTYSAQRIRLRPDEPMKARAYSVATCPEEEG